MSAQSKKKTQKQLSVPHKRTEEDVSYLADFEIRKAAKRRLPIIPPREKGDGETATIPIEHCDLELAMAILLDSVGTTDERFIDGLIKQIINAGGKGFRDFDFMLSVVNSIEPNDQIEAMLAVQMGAVHMATMTLAGRLCYVENIDQQNSAERAFNKLARTFTTQMEALNRHRGKGQQKMTVEHVHVHEGGQAIVGNVQGGGGKQKIGEQPHAKATDAPKPPLRGED